MSEDVKFPFKVNEKMIAAFNEDKAVARTTEDIIRAVYKAGIENHRISAWDLVREEHPELRDYKAKHLDIDFSYCFITESIRLVTNNK